MVAVALSGVVPAGGLQGQEKAGPDPVARRERIREEGPRRGLVGGLDDAVVLLNLVRLAGPPACVAASRDGSRVFGAPGQTVRQWDVPAGQVVNRSEGHASPIWMVALSRDGRSAISGGSDRIERTPRYGNGT